MAVVAAILNGDRAVASCSATRASARPSAPCCKSAAPGRAERGATSSSFCANGAGVWSSAFLSISGLGFSLTLDPAPSDSDAANLLSAPADLGGCLHHPRHGAADRRRLCAAGRARWAPAHHRTRVDADRGPPLRDVFRAPLLRHVPPVAVAAFAAASIAKADPLATALESMRFGWTAYIVPFLLRVLAGPGHAGRGRRDRHGGLNGSVRRLPGIGGDRRFMTRRLGIVHPHRLPRRRHDGADSGGGVCRSGLHGPGGAWPSAWCSSPTSCGSGHEATRGQGIDQLGVDLRARSRMWVLQASLLLPGGPRQILLRVPKSRAVESLGSMRRTGDRGLNAHASAFRRVAHLHRAAEAVRPGGAPAGLRPKPRRVGGATGGAVALDPLQMKLPSAFPCAPLAS